MLHITSSTIKYTNACFPPIKNLVPSENRIAVCLDPHACHGIIKDLILFQHSQSSIVY